MTSQSVLYLTVGLPGVGKTTLARAIADDQGILRLTPDEWMGPLFGHHDAAGRRDVLEGRMIWAAHQVLRGGVSVVLDFGCWSVDERFAIRAVAESVGARFDLRYVELDEAIRRARAAERWERAPETSFPMSQADHDRFVASFDPPTSAETEASELPDAPPGHTSWLSWASQRWPSLPDLGRGGEETRTS